MGSLGKSLGVRDFEIGLSLLVQNVHGSHGFDGGFDSFDEREGLTTGSVVLFQVKVSSSYLLRFG